MTLLYRNILLSILAIATAQGEDKTCTTPAPFANFTQPTIHIVMSITTGDYFTQLLEGAKLQAAKIDSKNEVQVAMSQSDGDDTIQAQLILDAANDPNTVGILTVDGHADTLCDAINTATNITLPVVSFDFDGAKCSDSPYQILTEQNDKEMAQSVLNQALLNQGNNVNVGYVNDLNYAPLLNRNKVWEEMKSENGWNELFFVDNAANYSSAEALQSAIEDALNNVETTFSGLARINFIYAPWDYLSVNTVKALGNTETTSSNGTVVYGADINNDDINVMTEPANSPWKATAGVDPRAIGASLIRMVSIASASSGYDELYDDYLGDDIEIPVTLVTQKFLEENKVTNMDELLLFDPELALPGFMQACWIDPIVGSAVNDETSSSNNVVEDPQEDMNTDEKEEIEIEEGYDESEVKDASGVSIISWDMFAGLLLAFALLMV